MFVAIGDRDVSVCVKGRETVLKDEGVKYVRLTNGAEGGKLF